MVKKKPSIEVKRHWERLVDEIGCVISGQKPCTIHHCHGGSMKFRGITTGLGLKTSDWLVIPLAFEFHTGNRGIDNGMGIYKGVGHWEANFGEQAHFLDMICTRLNINVWEMAESEEKK